MITRIEINGFKSFSGFSLDLAPFVVVAGVNGAGKSNFFDAIRLLARLAEMDIRSAFADQRGEAYELFTLHPDGSYARQMEFAVEMLVDRKVRDSWGSEAEIKYTRLRYELCLERRQDHRNIERLFVKREDLRAIPRSGDRWYQHYVGRHNSSWRPESTGGRSPFISSESDANTVNLHQDKGSRGRPRPIADLESTMLSGVTNTEFPHALAVREEMRHWRFMQLNPVALSKPVAKMTASEVMRPDGSGLASALFRIKQEEPGLISDIALDMSRLIPGIRDLDVREDEQEKKYTVSMTMEDGRVFSSLVLSEGTLRLLALATLKHDPQHRGVLCFEEPENGVHPKRIGQVVRLLRGLSTQFAEEADAPFPARQVLINTHSPLLVGEVCQMPQVAARGLVLFARQAIQVAQGRKIHHTRIDPVQLDGQTNIMFEKTDPEQGAVRFSKLELIQYLETADFGPAVSLLNEP
ncbi:MAG: AAA family ATPase [Bacteroidia bacterium]|nr:AAA family ATPase [Bacteroidia bacterium]